MYFLTFEGEFRGNDHSKRREVLSFYGLAPAFGPGAMHVEELQAEQDSHSDGHDHDPHESPITMTLPLLVLAVPSILIGFLGKPWDNSFEHFIHAPGETIEAVTQFDWGEFAIMAGSSVGISLIGITLAALMYLQNKVNPAVIADKFPLLYQFSLNKWYFDELYDTLFVRGCRRLARQVMEVDYRVVDGAVNLTGLAALVSGEGLRYLENGRAQFYALIIFAAVLGFVIFFSVT